MPRLIKLCQYEEAKKVRFMIDRILPKETKDFYAAFDASIEAMREKLRRKQTDQHLRKEEKIKSIQWDDIRRREMERKTYVPSWLRFYTVLTTTTRYYNTNIV